MCIYIYIYTHKPLTLTLTRFSSQKNRAAVNQAAVIGPRKQENKKTRKHGSSWRQEKKKKRKNGPAWA